MVDIRICLCTDGISIRNRNDINRKNEADGTGRGPCSVRLSNTVMGPNFRTPLVDETMIA